MLARLEDATNTPAVVLESPRGLADATLGAFPEVARRADLIVLIGKALDFTIRWASGPAFDPDVRLIAIDPEAALLERAAREKGDSLILGCLADARGAIETLILRAPRIEVRGPDWLFEARALLDHRLEAWATAVAETSGRVHPAEVFRVLHPYVEGNPNTVLICDGGEFAQWGQSLLPVRRRLISGVAGAIGASLSFALSARLLEPEAPIFAVLGDGTIGYHLAEFETAGCLSWPWPAMTRAGTPKASSSCASTAANECTVANYCRHVMRRRSRRWAATASWSRRRPSLRAPSSGRWRAENQPASM